MEYYNQKIVDELSDEILFNEYLKSNSTKKTSEKIKCIIDKFLPDEKANELLKELTILFIKAGLKGSVRGLKFNDMVKKYLENIYEDAAFEKNLNGMQERPDWFIKYEKQSKKHFIVGYNQIALWGGGAQTNRANKYLDDNFGKKFKNVKFIFVIAYKAPNTEKMKNGFKNNKLCYLDGLENLINKLMSED
jgi:hypothetical protein